jgi:dipeptidyl aminopeptidase/acylaminoacyl peptidase
VLLAPAILIAQGAATPPTYLTPPKPILEAALAPWWTNVTPTSPSPDGKRAIVVDRDGPPPLAWLAKPYVNLAGLMIDTGAYRARTLTTRSAAGLRIMDLATGALTKIEVPAGARISDPKWSPDGRTIAFMVHEDKGSRLFVADPASGKSHGLGKRLLMPTLCSTWDWTTNGKAIAAVFRPADPKPMPAEPPVAPAPRLQISDNRKTSLRTYPALLKSSYDETLLDYFATGQLATVDVASGSLHEIGKPMAIEALDSSPDGRGFRITLLERPYSGLVPLSSFPEREIVVDADGKELVELRKQGLRTGGGDEAEQAGPPAGPNARRGVAWRPDGSLVFLRAGSTDGKRTDRVMLWPYPFAKDAEKAIYEDEGTIGSLRFSKDGKTLFLTTSPAPTGGGFPGRRGGGAGQRPGAPTGSKLIAVRDGKSVALRETRGEDREPSSLVSEASGDVRLSPDGNSAYLSGTQSYDDPTQDAPRPFLERVSLTDGKRDRFWQSSAQKYESATILDDAATKLLLSRQSAVEVPQSYLVDLGTKAETPLTQNRDFAPDLTLARRETIVVTRADGVKFQVKVTSPKDAVRPPALFWIYPSEFETQEAYDRSKRSLNKNLFNQVGGSNKAALIRLGYAVVEPDVPVVAARERMNDTYVPQLRNSLSAVIDELDRRNLIDRSRLACGGHSYGAFSTANALVHTPFFKAGIAGDGNYLRALTPFGFQSDPRQMWEAREMYLGVSPLLYADQMTGALLMYHGMDDQNMGTAPINSERMFTALEALGKPAELIMYPYEDHGQIAKETVLDEWARFAAWLDKYLKG